MMIRDIELIATIILSHIDLILTVWLTFDFEVKYIKNGSKKSSSIIML